MIFDFDQTIIDDDSTSFIIKLLENSDFHENDLYKKHINTKWVEYVQDLLNRINNQKINITKIQNIFNKIKVTNGFLNLFNHLKENENIFESIILSNSNNLFINWWATNRNIPIKQIIANKAEAVSNTLIKIWNDQKSTCKYCPDLCKKMCLEEYVKDKQYKKLIYVGDGENDFCPAQVLDKGDYLFIRNKFPLHQMLSKTMSSNVTHKDLKANIKVWECGNEILQELKNINQLLV